jgi:hypothetical protein
MSEKDRLAHSSENEVQGYQRDRESSWKVAVEIYTRLDEL